MRPGINIIANGAVKTNGEVKNNDEVKTNGKMKTNTNCEVKTNGEVKTNCEVKTNGEVKTKRKSLNKEHVEDELKTVSESGLQDYRLDCDDDVFEDPRLFEAVCTYIGYFIIVIVGKLRDLLRNLGVEKTTLSVDPTGHLGFVTLYKSFESFFTRNIYRRIMDSFNRPICGTPGTHIEVVDRVFDESGTVLRPTGSTIKALNMGSYNYLGFAENIGPCTDSAASAVKTHGLGICSVRQELGTFQIHRELETLVAEFVGCESAITFGMGFATNSMNIPALIGPGCLIISDEMNHASLILGCRISGASIKTFRHNDTKSLEKVLKQAIIQGQPRKNRAWKKILVVVEGIYSMEGSICHLPAILELKKKYKFYLYLDEAHSIGAIGPHGRGVVDYYGLDAGDVDIMMGTFTKSFGSAGGYIAGRREVIDHLRTASHSAIYACAMPPALVLQTITSMSIMMGRDGSGIGQDRISKLAANTKYFRQRLKEQKLIVYGHKNSPVVPLITFHLSTMTYFCRQALKRGLAIVGVGYPATPLLKARVRFCISAKHTKEELDKALDIIADLTRETSCSKSNRKSRK